VRCNSTSVRTLPFCAFSKERCVDALLYAGNDCIEHIFRIVLVLLWGAAVNSLDDLTQGDLLLPQSKREIHTACALQACSASMTIYGALDRDNHPQRILFSYQASTAAMRDLQVRARVREHEQFLNLKLEIWRQWQHKTAAKMRNLLISKLSRKSAPNLQNQFVKNKLTPFSQLSTILAICFISKRFMIWSWKVTRIDQRILRF
jgi:hypothetical protein